MKIVIQTGEIVTRQDVDAFIVAISPALRSLVDTVSVLLSLDENIRVTYHAKERTLSLHSPKNGRYTADEAIDALATALLAVDEFGHIPDKISASRLSAYQYEWIRIQS